ncbi:BOLA class I histocompatibility antigen, alpha chain BL3-7-like [Zootoca vivipara]|uniref:BOLA class I histocompatibility antigen, alpha chain BL3-7-like n=1 Tax=Zootoca vivipara TaxID=8524 RepID=UPI00293BF1D0|nr:BOLA class I histocompatibility antigen, alpha chain BL3-7-like [Zootoca vivipara]
MGVLLRWPPLILWAAAHLLLLDCAGSTSHSLRYFFTAVSEPGQGLPQFITVGYVDDQQFVQYDSDTKKALPHVPWIRKAKKQDPYYWEKSMQHFQGAEDVLGLNLETLQYRFNKSEGFYSLQEMLGCDLSSDGRKGGYWQFGYDGRDFIAFDKETLTWTAANTQAQVTKEKWDPIKEQNQYRKAYLEEECIEWLQRYLDYGKETLLRTEAPVVKVTRKADYDSLETLVCQVHGFYPKEIDANWVRDGEVWQEGTSRGLVAPNSDGTYYVLLSVTIDPEERDRFRCRVEHDSLKKPLDVAWEKPGGSTSHSLRYFGTAMSEPGQGLPQFISVGYVDDQQFVQYDSDTKKALPRIPWIRKVEKEDPQYWHRATQTFQGNELRYRENLEIERNRYNQSGGIHTYQMMLGCELMSDGRKRGYRQYSYDGRDFIALDMETLTWTAADTEAQVIKRKWDAELAQNQYWKAYLEKRCIEWLQRYLDYGKETLLRTEAPVVKVTRKADYDSQETLVCQVHGFYPKEIDANWVKDGEVWQEGTSRGLVAPNSDGTYYVLLSVRIDPEERDRFRCRVEHDSLEKPLDVAWEKEPVSLGLIVGAILGVLAAILLVSGIVFFIIRRKRSEKLAYKAASTSDQGSDSSAKVGV